MASLRSRTSFSPAAPVVMNSVISTSLNWDVFTMPPLINFWRMALMKLAVKAPGCLAAKIKRSERFLNFLVSTFPIETAFTSRLFPLDLQRTKELELVPELRDELLEEDELWRLDFLDFLLLLLRLRFFLEDWISSSSGSPGALRSPISGC